MAAIAKLLCQDVHISHEMFTSHMRCSSIALALSSHPALCVPGAVLAAGPGSDHSAVPGAAVMGSRVGVCHTFLPCPMTWSSALLRGREGGR